MKEGYKVLVPMDFTKEAEAAISYAAFVANSFKGSIVLLHIIPNEKAKEKAVAKLEAEAQKASKEYGLTVNYEIKQGSIFDQIPKVADEINAMLVVMGTHGVKGIQHITGSYALKVIGHSKIPFIVTQSKKCNNTIKDLVLPIRFSEETKSKLSTTASIAKHFGAIVRIFTSNESDEFLRTKVNREVIFAKHYFDERGVKYEIEKAAEYGNFLSQMLVYANDVDADMIAIVNSSGDVGFLPDLFKGSGEIEVLNNKYSIPAIVTNPSQMFVPEHFG